jgi:hypothetical protein
MFFKKVRGALWVCLWNRGGGGPKKFGNHCSKRCVAGLLEDSGLVRMWKEAVVV